MKTKLNLKTIISADNLSFKIANILLGGKFNLKQTQVNSMNLKNIIMLISSVLIIGCANTRYTEYRGKEVFQGKGGSVRQVSGIEVWENGEPDRKYKIIGFAEDNRQGGLIGNAVWDSAIAKVTKEKGGDAVVVVSSTKVLSGIDLKTGDAEYEKQSKIIIIKYLD